MSSSLLTRALAASSIVTAASKTPVLRAGFSASRLRASTAAQIASGTSENETIPSSSFQTLKGLLSHNTYQALVGEPMKLRNMTSVQREVLSHLPEISEPYNSKSPAAVRDLLVRAKTGTGKTLAFLIPAVEAREKAVKQAGKQALIDSGLMSDDSLERRARKKYSRETVGVLILSPTRELATQIANEAMRLLHHHHGMEVRSFTGGINKRLQMREWMKGSRDVVVATTGRLRDLMASEPEVLKSIKTAQTFILDEADTMLDMGFRDDIHAIQRELPRSPTRQTLLFSATVSPVIRQVATNVLAKDYKFIDCVKSDDSPVHAHVPQYHTVLPNASSQIPHILKLIAHDQLTNPISKIILFLPTTRMTQLFAVIIKRLAMDLFPVKTNVHEIHSKRTMEGRVRTSADFRKERSPASILVTSDVSARGVDYPGVTRVIQVGVPGSADQYIHRIGRTGRTGGLVGRGDLVLLPWEIGFITWQLTDVPIKPVTAREITLQLEELSKQADSEPNSHPNVRTPYTPRLSDLDSAPGEIVSRFDEEAIRETFMSMLGYYVTKSGELRVQRGVILEGCKDWSTQACGLQTAPFVSDDFLNKLGVGNSSKSNSASRYARPGQFHWQMRGNSSRNKERSQRDPGRSWNDNGRGGRAWSRDSNQGRSSSWLKGADESNSNWSRSRDTDESHGNWSRDRDNSRGSRSGSYGGEYDGNTRSNAGSREFRPRSFNRQGGSGSSWQR
ncbi:P-loop containing nucleoside triphosphate hydrolase protein [Lentinula aciculospora]|uniref:ATP-dependent RNA helicase n=1 Tax=Lentinula aciculospora TaxID=153920 RepID=A0A9W8ZV11_9AGAR|nr:P-loop containing nucleoside triphosphate hydrolase protein [Lentinula aciculospora]